MSLSNIESLEEMKKRKYDWKTEESIEKLDKAIGKFVPRRLLSKSRMTSGDDDSFKVEQYDVRTFRLKISDQKVMNKKFDQIYKN